jgi:hypothetical protein
MATIKLRNGSTVTVPDVVAADYERRIAAENVKLPAGDPDESWTKKQLTALAARDSIDLTGAKTKPLMLAAIGARTAS